MSAMALETVIWVERRARTLAYYLLALAVAASIGVLVAQPAHAKTFTVNYAGDEEDHDPGDGVCDTLPHPQLIACTLRAAIEEANESGAADTINFDIGGGSGVKVIKPSSQLPIITNEVTIDGYTQLGASPNIKAKGTNAVLKIVLNGADAGPFARGLRIEASNSVVKGLVINRFDDSGVELSGSNNKVRGNFIGTNPGGTLDRGNIGSGVRVRFEGASGNTIGGATPATRNLISGNIGGISINSGASANKIQGNLIGTKKDGTGVLGNFSSGVSLGFGVGDSASENTVGGNTSGTANIIAFNGSDGIEIEGAASTGNRILRNSIFSNDGLGIDLAGGVETNNGRTFNDPADEDTGPNELQNTPFIASAENSGGETTIEGSLSSTSNGTFTVRFFSNPSGNEGKKFIGQKSVTTNASGSASFAFVPAQKVPIGQNVTATATNTGGNTSEFSLATIVT